MKRNKPDNDAPLDALLREWKVNASLPPRFGDQVWQRIHRAETPLKPSFLRGTLFANWITTLLPRPALATAYVAVLIAIGAGVGWSQARQKTARVSGDLRARYVHTVDPYQAPR